MDCSSLRSSALPGGNRGWRSQRDGVSSFSDSDMRGGLDYKGGGVVVVAFMLRCMTFVALVCAASPFASHGGLVKRQPSRLPSVETWSPNKLQPRLQRRTEGGRGGFVGAGVQEYGVCGAKALFSSLKEREGVKYLQLVRSDDSLEMQTAEMEFVEGDLDQREGLGDENGGESGHEKFGVENKTCVNLFFTMHLADGEYYEELSRDLDRESCRVLFEMVVSNRLCDMDSDGLRRLKDHPKPSRAQAALASSYMLKHQLDKMNFSADSRWIIADLDSDTVNDRVRANLEECEGDFASGLDNPYLAEMARSTGKPLVQEWFSRGGSKASWEADATPVRLALGAVRVVSCVLPCPELSFLLLDFASDNGGRLDVGITAAILRRVCNLDFANARKILYAQHLVAGQLQEPGGAYRVLIRDRNEQALGEICRAKRDGCKKVSLLYGVMHATDLAQRCRELGLKEGASSWRTAWKIRDEGGAKQNVITCLAVGLLVGSSFFHWWDMATWLKSNNDCLWFGATEVVESVWPNTDVVVPVVQHLQCPGDSQAAAQGRAVFGYFGLHFFMLQILRKILM